MYMDADIRAVWIVVGLLVCGCAGSDGAGSGSESTEPCTLVAYEAGACDVSGSRQSRIDAAIAQAERNNGSARSPNDPWELLDCPTNDTQRVRHKADDRSSPHRCKWRAATTGSEPTNLATGVPTPRCRCGAMREGRS